VHNEDLIVFLTLPGTVVQRHIHYAITHYSIILLHKDACRGWCKNNSPLCKRLQFTLNNFLHL